MIPLCLHRNMGFIVCSRVQTTDYSDIVLLLSPNHAAPKKTPPKHSVPNTTMTLSGKRSQSPESPSSVAVTIASVSLPQSRLHNYISSLLMLPT